MQIYIKIGTRHSTHDAWKKINIVHLAEGHLPFIVRRVSFVVFATSIFIPKFAL